MADRKKVINALGRCESYGYCEDKRCPYYEDTSCLESMRKDALELLKEQEAIAPKLIKMYPYDIYECGNCKHRSVGSKDYKAKYCPECGRKVKWDG